MNKVEYGNTATLILETMLWDATSETYLNVTPDNYSVFLEEHSDSLVQLTELTETTMVEAGVFWIKFLANTTTYTDLKIGGKYFITLYWDLDDEEKAERERVVVVANV